MSTFPAERTAIITGAVSERGIGRATANYLAAQGWNVGIIDLDDARCKATAKELAAEHGVKAYGAGANIGDEASVRAAIDEIEAELPQIVALANVAGVSSPVPYLELDAAEWDRVLSINLNGVHYATRRVAESMVKNGIGRIVNISSVSAQRGGGTFSKTPYSVAKAGVIGLTRCHRPGTGPLRHHGQRHLSGSHRHRHHGRHAQRGTQGRTDPGPRGQPRWLHPGHRRRHRLPHQRGRRLHLRPDAECGWRTLHALRKKSPWHNTAKPPLPPAPASAAWSKGRKIYLAVGILACLAGVLIIAFSR